jgi:class 3 adenylate cyclase/tetratricopeptide (TPR) repeat protein
VPLPSIEQQIAQLRSAISAQEALRPTLGDAMVEVTLKALRTQLDSLLAEQNDEARPKPGLSPEVLLAQLRSHVPRQLADKARAAGQIEGERRQVTVVFADISGFTALSERLDDEDVAGLTNDCLKELAQAVYQYEGMVDKFIGDCIMAVFGAPIALEDDAERALRATISMRENLQRFNRRWIGKLGHPLDVHIGVNTGIVIAGNVGSDLQMSYTVIGDTVNVAARLQDAAQAGQVFVSRNTYRLTRGAFAFQEMDPIKVKGKRDPLTVYELLHVKLQPDKSRGVEGLSSPLVGRDAERKALVECFEKLQTGRGHVATILGEAGIGKSRLLAEIHRREGMDLTWLEGRCYAFSRSLSYGAFLDLLRRYAGIAVEDAEAEAAASLNARLNGILPGDLESYAVLAQLLSMRLDSKETGDVGAISGEAFRNRLLAVLERMLLALAKQRPVVVVLDDFHWADHSSLELLNHLLQLITQAPIAFVLLSRPRRESSGNLEKLGPALEACQPNVLEIQLTPLSGESSGDLVRELLDGSMLPAKLSEVILNKSEGNPFFVEEVLRSLIDRGVLARKNGVWKVTELVENIQVPDSLQGVLLSRLDRLPEETKRVIQKAAVIGRVFLLRVLDYMAREETELKPQMALLEDAALVRERARVPEIEYVFRHALTQEVAYQTLLTPSRRLLHRSVGQAMESIFSDRIDQHRALLAYHFFKGEDWERAFEYSFSEADAAVQLYAYAEAREYYHRALDSLKHLPDNASNRQKQVDTSVRLVNVSLQSESPEKNLVILAEAENLASSLADEARIARIQLWIGRVHYLAGRLREAISYFEKVLAVAPESGDPELMALPGAVIGRVLFLRGQFAKAHQLLERAVPFLGATENRHELLFACLYRGASRACLGDYAAGSAELDQVLKTAQANRDQNAETMAHTALAMIRVVAGKHHEAMEAAQAALAVAEKSGDAMFRYSSYSFMAWALTGLGEHQRALERWSAAHEAAQPLGGRLLLGEWLAAIESDTLLGAGDIPSALEKAEEALAAAKAAGSLIAEALSESAIGNALAAGPEPDHKNAEAHLARSLSLLESIGAKFDLARVSLALGRVRTERKDWQGASSLLEQAASLASQCSLHAVEAEATDRLKEIGTARAQDSDVSAEC